MREGSRRRFSGHSPSFDGDIVCCWPVSTPTPACVLNLTENDDIQGSHGRDDKKGISQVPRPTFGSGLGLQCVYTVVISLWGTPAPKFVLEPPKTVFYWILLCIRKPQAEFQKFSSTHVSPSNRFISSPQLPLLVGTKDEEYLPIWTLYFSVHVSLHFFVDDLP